MAPPSISDVGDKEKEFLLWMCLLAFSQKWIWTEGIRENGYGVFCLNRVPQTRNGNTVYSAGWEYAYGKK
jgi:hypothetical protein